MAQPCATESAPWFSTPELFYSSGRGEKGWNPNGKPHAEDETPPWRKKRMANLPRNGWEKKGFKG